MSEDRDNQKLGMGAGWEKAAAEPAARPGPGYIKSVGVFCGSRCGDDPFYVLQSYLFGRWAAENNFRVVYGGGDIGNMGALRQGVVEAGGEFVSINLEAFQKSGVQSHVSGAVKEYVAASPRERTRMFIYQSDVLVALPGGIGTIQEIIDNVSAADLSHYDPIKDVIPQLMILNTRGIHSGGKAWLQATANEGFTEISRVDKVVHFFDTRKQLQAGIFEANGHSALVSSDLGEKKTNGSNDYRAILRQYGWSEGEGLPDDFDADDMSNTLG